MNSHSPTEKLSEDGASARGSLSGFGEYTSMDRFISKLPQQSALPCSRAPSTESVTHKLSDGTQGSLYKMGRYKEALTAVLERLTCAHCKEILTDPVILDCGHTVCWACAEKIVRKNKTGQGCCCCPKCGVESVTEGLLSRTNLTLWEAAAVVHVVTACLGKGRSTPEVSSAGDSESGCSLGTSCSINSMKLPPFMASTRELFIRMFLPTDGLGSEDGLSQRSSGFWDCSENEQRSEDGTSARGSLSGSVGLCEPELPQQRTVSSPRADILDLLTRMTSDGTPRSVYKTSPYKQVLVDILEPFTCPHCKEILGVPVTLDCGHNVCLACAEKISSKNKEGRQCCCCPKCGAESVTKYWRLKVNWALSKSVNAVREQTVVLWYLLRTLEACSDGDSEDGMGDSVLDCSWSIGTIYPPLDVLPKTELFERMFLAKDGLESEDELSGCTENEQRYKNKVSPRWAFSLFVRHLSRRLRDPELSKKKKKKKNITVPFRSRITTHDF